jgi:hypothetical protein
MEKDVFTEFKNAMQERFIVINEVPPLKLWIDKVTYKRYLFGVGTMYAQMGLPLADSFINVATKNLI